ncbi:MAG TPA: hypothetical protein VLA61_21050 [Ideonella sp.]|uniref:hypothetical protein n=1 Tax=Ideonella sp. TaxID=1929293 RepID=UPI002BB851EE|nr:hypothetical protein [Ideonella sp.]HSI50764.1 hypothetical protein [Ideonella sp.]
MNPQSPFSASEADLALRRHTEALGNELQSAVGALLAAVEDKGARDQKAFQAALGLGQSAVSRLLSSVRSGDPLTTLVNIPGAQVLAQMLRGAERTRLDPGLLARAAAAVQAFETFVDVQFGDRATLDTVLSEWVLESRAAIELRQKTLAFKATSALRGVQADLVLSTGIVYPSRDNPERHDGIGIDALLGCRRLKPSGLLRLNFSSLSPEESRFKALSLNGQPVTGMQDLLLREFSSVQPEQLQTEQNGRVIQTSVFGLPLSREQGRGHDIVYVQVYNNAHRARRGAGGPTSGMAAHAEPPTECCVIDALLHDDVWPDIQPELRLYDTVIRGIAHPDDPSRFGDRMDMVESVQFLGRGPEAFRLPEYARYPELIRRACAEREWNASKLRGYRIKVRYPIYGSQIGMAFRLLD